MCQDCYEPTPLTASEKRRRALLRIPGVLTIVQTYLKACGRIRCIMAILRGDAVIFGATIREGEVTAGRPHAILGIGDFIVAESTVERCTITATRTNIGFRSRIVGNYVRRPDEPTINGAPTQLVR